MKLRAYGSQITHHPNPSLNFERTYPVGCAWMQSSIPIPVQTSRERIPSAVLGCTAQSQFKSKQRENVARRLCFDVHPNPKPSPNYERTYPVGCAWMHSSSPIPVQTSRERNPSAVLGCTAQSQSQSKLRENVSRRLCLDAQLNPSPSPNFERTCPVGCAWMHSSIP